MEVVIGVEKIDYLKIKKENLYIVNNYMEVVYVKKRKNRYISKSIRKNMERKMS